MNEMNCKKKKRVSEKTLLPPIYKISQDEWIKSLTK